MSVPHLKPFELVVAQTRLRGIGNKGQLPWPRLPIDMAHFVEITSTTSDPTDSSKMNAVIMGRKTWESIPKILRPLKNRINIVVSSQPELFQNENNTEQLLIIVPSFDQAHLVASSHPFVDKILVIGGHSLLDIGMKSPYCEIIHLSEVFKHYECDVFMPHINPSVFDLTNVSELLMDGLDNNIPVQFLTYTRNRAIADTLLQNTLIYHVSPTGLPEYIGEQGYLDLLRYVIAHGIECKDRTGVGTKSIFGAHIRYNLRDSFPLFTTKRTFFRGIIEELLWFIRGSTNANELKDKGVHIWDGNSTREFLNSRGLVNNASGDLGPVYGFQWRHFGAEYKDFNTDYSGKGVDQLKGLIEEIKKNPDSRRLVMSAWNAAAVDEMALPPCHVLSQFRVYNGELSCLLYSRSNDLCLGTPFNVSSYALLTYMVAHVCGLKPGELVHCMGDCHIYLNHLEPIKQQLVRTPKTQPTLKIKREYNPDATDNTQIQSIDDFVFEDFLLEGYCPYPAVKMDMAI